MNATERTPLMTAFERILDNDDDPVIKLLVMTYEFDDQQLLNMLIQRPLSDRLEPTSAHAARLADLAPVVIYDARKTRPGSALPHFLDLLPVRVGAWRCHHPKAYLVVTRKRVHLVLGSMNLTASGLFSNREAFCVFSWCDETLTDLHLLESFVALLASEYRAFESESLEEVLSAVGNHVNGWRDVHPAPPSTTTRLVANGFGSESGPLRAIEQLQLLYREHFGADPPETLHVVSPFFDRGIGDGLLIHEIESRLGVPECVEIATDESALTWLSRPHLGRASRQVVYAIPPEISAGERRLISGANDGAATEALALERRLHSKILILGRGRRRLVYIGSGNFTRKAWYGDNHELGVAWVEDGDAAVLWSEIRKGLCCSVDDHFQSLAQHLSMGDQPPDDDDYMVAEGYPDFITGIVLSWLDDQVQFIVHTMPDKALQLGMYRITWEKTVLVFTVSADGRTARSQFLDVARVRALVIGGRNLLFVSADNPGIEYFLPFRHDRDLFDRRFEFVHPTADDWMSHCLGRDRDTRSVDPDESLPDDWVRTTNERALDEREVNPIIRTQRYLSDFQEVEEEFRKRAADWAACANPSPLTWQQRIGQPLVTFSRILERTITDHVDATFRLGELKLLVSELCGPEDGLRELGETLLAAFHRRAAAASNAGLGIAGVDSYRRLVEGSLK